MFSQRFFVKSSAGEITLGVCIPRAWIIARQSWTETNKFSWLHKLFMHGLHSTIWLCITLLVNIMFWGVHQVLIMLNSDIGLLGSDQFFLIKTPPMILHPTDNITNMWNEISGLKRTWEIKVDNCMRKLDNRLCNPLMSSWTVQTALESKALASVFRQRGMLFSAVSYDVSDLQEKAQAHCHPLTSPTWTWSNGNVASLGVLVV